MHILHTESSSGWGGQEIRILREAEGMRKKGHEVVMAVARGGGLVTQAREKGFTVYEVSFKRQHLLGTLFQLLKIIKRHGIEIINTHSSLDSWVGGIAGRMSGRKIVRTRHLSTAIRKGLNSRLLYNALTDFVVTTSSAIIPTIAEQSRLSADAIKCIATGVNPDHLKVDPQEVAEFRKQLKLKEGQLLVGTACFVRSWKGIKDFMKAAALLKDDPRIKWVIVGGGYVNDYKGYAEELGVQHLITFTGHLDRPFPAIAAMDLFLLLSTAHEGISQATLQAAYLERPLITTNVGGLPEVCIEGQTGLIVPPFSPESVASAVHKLANDSDLRHKMGASGKKLVEEKYLLQQTIDQMEQAYKSIF